MLRFSNIELGTGWERNWELALQWEQTAELRGEMRQTVHSLRTIAPIKNRASAFTVTLPAEATETPCNAVLVGLRPL